MFSFKTTVGEAKMLGERLQRLAGSSNKPAKALLKPAKPDEIPDEPIVEETVEDVEVNLAFYVKNLGTTAKGLFEKHPNCLVAIKNMLLQIKRTEHSPKLTVRRFLINTGIVNTDLYPVLMSNPKDAELWRATIWLMEELTMPPKEISLRIPRDILEDSVDVKMRLREMDDRRQACKKVFADPLFFSHLREHLSAILKKPADERDKIDIGFLRHSLNLISNILEMRGEVHGKQADSPATLHDKVFKALFASKFTAVIIYIACAEKYSSFRVLEILYHLLRYHDPETLNQAEMTTESCQENDKRLQSIYERSLAEKTANPLKSFSRHSAFGGTFVLKGAKASNRENDMVLVKPLNNILGSTFELTADKKPESRSRKTFKAKEEKQSFLPISSPELRTFCMHFLQNAYSMFMENLKNEIPHLLTVREVQEPEEYILRYLWALRYFMAFNRFSDFRVEYVSGTVSLDTFRFIWEKMENFLEMMRLNKTETVKWSERVHATLKSYQELLWTVSVMLSHPDETVQRAAKQLESNVFYSDEHRDMFFNLLKEYHEGRFSRSYLADLIVTVHIFVKLIETCLKSQSQLFVRAKQRKRKTNKQPAKMRAKKGSKNLKDERLAIWDQLAEKLREILDRREEKDDSFIPYDPASDVPVDDQKDTARFRIQNALLEKDAARAVSLLKAAKEVWISTSETVAFGTADDSSEEDLARLKDIIMLDMADLEPEKGTDIDGDVLGDEEIEDDTEPAKGHGPKEVQFHMDTYVKRFAHQSHLEPYIILLKSYTTNSFMVNHAIMKMFHRIAWDLKMTDRFFQMILFRISYEMNNSTRPNGDARFLKEFQEFMRYILTDFFEQLRKNPAVILGTVFSGSRLGISEPEDTPMEKPVKAAENDEQAVGQPRQLREESPEDDYDVFDRLREMNAQAETVQPKNNQAKIVKPSKAKNPRPARERSPEDDEGVFERLRKLNTVSENGPKKTNAVEPEKTIKATERQPSRDSSPESNEDVFQRLRTMDTGTAKSAPRKPAAAKARKAEKQERSPERLSEVDDEGDDDIWQRLRAVAAGANAARVRSNSPEISDIVVEERPNETVNSEVSDVDRNSVKQPPALVSAPGEGESRKSDVKSSKVKRAKFSRPESSEDEEQNVITNDIISASKKSDVRSSKVKRSKFSRPESSEDETKEQNLSTDGITPVISDSDEKVQFPNPQRERFSRPELLLAEPLAQQTVVTDERTHTKKNTEEQTTSKRKRARFSRPESSDEDDDYFGKLKIDTAAADAEGLEDVVINKVKPKKNALQFSDSEDE